MNPDELAAFDLYWLKRDLIDAQQYKEIGAIVACLLVSVIYMLAKPNTEPMVLPSDPEPTPHHNKWSTHRAHHYRTPYEHARTKTR